MGEPSKFLAKIGASIAVMATVVAGCAGPGPQANQGSTAPTSASGNGVERIFFQYSGYEYANFSAIGMLTSFTAPVLYKKLSWNYNFAWACAASLEYNGAPEAGSEIYCTDTTSGNIFGEYNLQYLAGAQGTNCFTHLAVAPGA